MERIILKLFLVMAALVAGCTQLAGIKHNPDITLAGIELVEFGLLEQRFILKMRIQNPNDIALHINGITFDVELNGVAFAKGLSDKVVIVPRLGETVMEVKATSTLGMIWKQLGELQKSSRDKVDYRLSGRLFLQGLGSVPFEQKGNVSMPNGADDLEKL
ncbi:LEA type 2 family protein [Nitrosomonas sp. Nm132]|jgi:LEA14-like dessication related protein|uniref:LEA type 2 family protein n=1 Tax=Nitrosomonas sp. Nm132 TaxID=1881053 RepID=UPI0008853CE1|nr:LEA type 2 family protein [Nitrosomonas sp. Nm132]SDH14316.1 LEA14-like dessication related protein [Nitrosomonas sp. Nm132]